MDIVMRSSELVTTHVAEDFVVALADNEARRRLTASLIVGNAETRLLTLFRIAST